MAPEQAAREFDKRLRDALAADPRKGNAQFGRIGPFLQSLTTVEASQACLQDYMGVYKRVETDANRPRSDGAFYLVLKRVLELVKPEQVQAWSDVLTSPQRPFSPVRDRFEALGASDDDDRRRLLGLLADRRRAAAQARPASVLGELRDAWAKTHPGTTPTLADLLEFDPLNDAALRREYESYVSMLEQAYDDYRQIGDAKTALLLGQRIDALWAFAREQRKDGLRLFQLLQCWRADRKATPTSYARDVAYLHIAGALISYAVSSGKFRANVLAKGLTAEEWTFVLAPLRRLLYYSSYKRALEQFFVDEKAFPRKCELFLRLIAFAARTGSTLAREEELEDVVRKLASTPKADLQQRTFRIGDDVASQWYTKDVYRLDQQIGTSLVIVYFAAQRRPTKIYVEFARARGVLFWVDFSTFVGYAERGPYELVYAFNAGLLRLLPFFFELIAAIPGVVDGGFIGLIEALLQPAEEVVAADVLEEFGLDPDKAGWLVVAANLAAHHVGGAAGLGKPPVRGLEELGSGDRGLVRSLERTGAEQPAELTVGGRATGGTATVSPGTTTAAIEATDTQMLATAERGADATAVKAVDQVERGLKQPVERVGPPPRPKPKKGTGSLEAEETRAEPVSARAKGKDAKKGAGDDPESGKGTSKAAKGTGNPGTASRAVPPPPPRGPRMSPQGYLSVNVGQSGVVRQLRAEGWTVEKVPLIRGKGEAWQVNVSGVEYEWQLTSPSGAINVKLDGLALASADAKQLTILEAKAGYTDILERSAHFRFSDDKVAQLTHQLAAVLESNGRIDKVIVVCNKQVVAETYANISAQHITGELRRSFRAQARAWLERDAGAPVKRLLQKDLERIVDEHVEIVWSDWASAPR